MFFVSFVLFAGLFEKAFYYELIVLYSELCRRVTVDVARRLYCSFNRAFYRARLHNIYIRNGAALDYGVPSECGVG